MGAGKRKITKVGVLSGLPFLLGCLAGWKCVTLEGGNRERSRLGSSGGRSALEMVTGSHETEGEPERR